ncbi:MAG TPA: ATP-binding cassette domain-containing protein, partial [Thermoanaerobaculia bacterium]|nr:ATP-binding cassette domain-containing protein [Thermoanaerobaculia bacterium]
DPDILLLDEPTNHLDLQMILKLEEWLLHEVNRIPLLVVSHDRRFLDNCTNRTLFLRPRESVAYAYPFSKARDLLAEYDQALLNRKEREQKEAQRLRQSAHNLRQIGVNNYSAAALRKSIQIARRAEVIEDAMTEVHVEPRRDIKLTSRDTHAKCLVGIEGITVRQPNGGALFTLGKLDIWQGDRVALLGRNGTGKTCFVEYLRACFGARDAARGDGVRIAPSAVMGYVDQNMSQLPSEEEVGKYVAGLIGRDRATSALIAAGFPIGQHSAKIGTQSLGEKARLALLVLQLAEPSFYLMDEPTNHIDIPGQEQLEAEILAHATTGILVSHDRAFVANTATRFLVVDEGRLFELDSPEPFYAALAANISIGEATSGLRPL